MQLSHGRCLSADSGRRCCTCSWTGRVVSISPSFSPVAEGSALGACPCEAPWGSAGRWLWTLAGLSFSWGGSFSPGTHRWSSGSCSAVLGALVKCQGGKIQHVASYSVQKFCMLCCCYRVAMGITAGYTDWYRGQIPAHKSRATLIFFWLLGKKPVSFAALHLPIPVVTMLLSSPAFFPCSRNISSYFLLTPPKSDEKLRKELILEYSCFVETAQIFKLYIEWLLNLGWIYCVLFLERTSIRVCKAVLSVPAIAIRGKYSEVSVSGIHRFHGAESILGSAA